MSNVGRKRPCLFSDIYPSTKKSSTEKEKENKDYYSKFEYGSKERSANKTPESKSTDIMDLDDGVESFVTRKTPTKDAKEEARIQRI